jgi:hypothetical protein
MKFEQCFKLLDEESHQAAFFGWCRIAARHGFVCAWAWARDEDFALVADSSKAVRALSKIHSVPNGANMGDSVRQRMINAVAMKKAGLTPGVYDVFLPARGLAEPSGEYCGYYIEFKNPKYKDLEKRLSDSQLDFKHEVELQGYKTGVFSNWEKAAISVENYLKR